MSVKSAVQGPDDLASAIRSADLKVGLTAYSDHTGEGTIRDRKWLDGKLSFAADFKNHLSIAAHAILKDGKLAGEVQHPEGPTYQWEANKK